MNILLKIGLAAIILIAITTFIGIGLNNKKTVTTTIRSNTSWDFYPLGSPDYEK
mgnify:CR=1 FL=1